MSSRYINLNDYRNFSVRVKDLDEGCYHWILTNVDYDTAREAADLNLIGKPYILGHHKTAQGGAGDTIVWDGRD